MIIIITLSYMSSIMNLLSINFLPRRSLSGSSWRGSDMIDSFVNYMGVGNARCCSSWKSKPLNHKNIKHKHLHKHIFYSHYDNDRGQEVKCILYKKTGLRFDVIFVQIWNWSTQLLNIAFSIICRCSRTYLLILISTLVSCLQCSRTIYRLTSIISRISIGNKLLSDVVGFNTWLQWIG